jgi:hypothetical protein
MNHFITFAHLPLPLGLRKTEGCKDGSSAKRRTTGMQGKLEATQPRIMRDLHS